MKKMWIVLFVLLLIGGCDWFESNNEDPDNIDTNPIIDDNPVDTSNEWKVTIERDNEQYNWLKQLQDISIGGFVPSTDFGYNVSLYDNALAAIVFTMYGDYSRSEDIFDYFNARRDIELNDEYGGFSQFRNYRGEIENGIGKRWLGDNAWLLVSLHFYKKHTNSNRYDDMISELDQWIRSLQQSDGSIIGGYNEDGSEIHVITEGMIDAYVAVEGFDSFHQGILDFLEMDRYNSFMELMMAWPENPRYELALDVLTWGYMAFPEMPIWTLKAADDFFKMSETHGNETVYGYCFDVDLDTIWLEGSMQMAVAYIWAGPTYYDRALFIIEEAEKLMIKNTYGEGSGLSYASSPGTHYAGGALWTGADTDIYVSSTTWYLLAQEGVNPFDLFEDQKEPDEVINSMFYNN